nr:hypothetical protein Hi04_10k_c2877_00008 [uncultured bacterium]
MRSAILNLVLAGCGVLTACGNNYVYAPTVSTSATIGGRLASYYSIPQEEPRGDVRIATFGFAEIGSREGEETLKALHTRMIVANNSEYPWSVDTREQRIAVPGDGESQPAFATTSGGLPPIVDIPPKEVRTIDLFYPLPPDVQKASKLPSFDTLWTVHTDTREVTERTPFERLTVQPTVGEDYGYAWGPPYFYDPLLSPTGAFVGARVDERFRHPAYIRPGGPRK